MMWQICGGGTGVHLRCQALTVCLRFESVLCRYFQYELVVCSFVFSFVFHIGTGFVSFVQRWVCDQIICWSWRDEENENTQNSERAELFGMRAQVDTSRVDTAQLTHFLIDWHFWWYIYPFIIDPTMMFSDFPPTTSRSSSEHNSNRQRINETGAETKNPLPKMW